MEDIFKGIEPTSESVKRVVKRAIRMGALKDNNKDGTSRLFKILSEIVKRLDKDGSPAFHNMKDFNDKYKFIYDLYKSYDKSKPLCRECGIRHTDWNINTMKYKPICDNEICIRSARERYESNMVEVHGTHNLAATVNGQINMQRGRSIAKEYIWEDGNISTVLGNVELAVMGALEDYGIQSNDAYTPAPFIIHYKIPGEDRSRTHYPDIFVESLNLIISCKDGLENPNRSPHFKKDRLKNVCEYMSILNTTRYNYVQIEGLEGVKDLPDILNTIKEMGGKSSRYVVPPRIDFMLYGENYNIKYSNRIVLNLLIDGDDIVIPYLSESEYSTVGYTIIDKKAILIDISKLDITDSKITSIIIDLNSEISLHDITSPSSILSFNINTTYDLMSLILTGEVIDWINVSSMSYDISNFMSDISNLVTSSRVVDIKLWQYNIARFDKFKQKERSVSYIDNILGDEASIRDTPIYGILLSNKDTGDNEMIYYIIGGNVLSYDIITHEISHIPYNKDFHSKILNTNSKVDTYTRMVSRSLFMQMSILIHLMRARGNIQIKPSVYISVFSSWIHMLSIIYSTLFIELLFDVDFNRIMEVIFNIDSMSDMVKFSQELIDKIGDITDDEMMSHKMIKVSYSDKVKDKLDTILLKINNIGTNNYKMHVIKNTSDIDIIKATHFKADNKVIFKVLK